MQILSAVFWAVVLSMPSMQASADVILFSGTRAIIIIDDGDFAAMPRDEQGRWLDDRAKLIGDVSKDLESLNQDEIGVIERVGRFQPELQAGFLFLGEVEVLEHRQIPTLITGSPQAVARRVARTNLAHWDVRDAGGIEPL